MKKLLIILGVILTMIMGISMTACGQAEKDTNYMHLSIDDNVFCFEDLAKNNYDSLFDQPYFKGLKELHDEYGAVISLYTYNKTLDKVGEQYVDDFKANSSWLKLGLHADEHYGVNRNVYQEMMEYDFGYDEAKTFWNDFTANVTRICGSLDSLDRIPRLEYYCAKLEYVQGLRDADNGALGFLVRGDGSHELMYYDAEIGAKIQKENYYVDSDNDFTLVGTDLTIESLLVKEPAKPNFKDLTADEIAHVNPLTNLSNRLSSDQDFAKGPFIVFSHEYCYYYGESVLPTFTWLKSACEFAKTNQIPFAYSQDKLI